MKSSVIVACASLWSFTAFAIPAGEVVSCETESSSHALMTYEGSWDVTGALDDPAKASEPVEFRVLLLSDGTFVDRDNYRGHWIASGGALSFAYFDESELIYVGQIDGDRVEGRFAGAHTSGTFVMSRFRPQ